MFFADNIKPSVSRAIGLLKNGGYVISDSYGFLSLTAEGKELDEKNFDMGSVILSQSFYI